MTAEPNWSESPSVMSDNLWTRNYTLHGILQARILEWVAFPFSRGSSQPMELNPVLPHCRHILYQLSHKGNGLKLLIYLPICIYDLSILKQCVCLFVFNNCNLESSKLEKEGQWDFDSWLQFFFWVSWSVTPFYLSLPQNSPA